MKVLLLVNENLIPPMDLSSEKSLLKAAWKTELHVASALKGLGYELKIQGVGDDLISIKKAIEDFRPNIVFNLLEEFAGEAVFDQNIVSYLEIIGMKYTGCNPTGLILSRDKSLSKKIFKYHSILSPKFEKVFFRKKEIKNFKLKSLSFPCIVKSLNEEASMGISQKSIVNNLKALNERISFVHKKYKTDVIVEEYIRGRELYVGVIGNQRPQTFPIWEVYFNKLKEVAEPIATEDLKWNQSYRDKYKIEFGPAKDLSIKEERQILRLAKKAYIALGLSGYARFDFRLSEENKAYILEANPNPDISSDDEFASSALYGGLDYKVLVKKIIDLGMKWTPVQGSR